MKAGGRQRAFKQKLCGKSTDTKRDCILWRRRLHQYKTKHLMVHFSKQLGSYAFVLN